MTLSKLLISWKYIVRFHNNTLSVPHLHSQCSRVRFFNALEFLRVSITSPHLLRWAHLFSTGSTFVEMASICSTFVEIVWTYTTSVKLFLTMFRFRENILYVQPTSIETFLHVVFPISTVYTVPSMCNYQKPKEIVAPTRSHRKPKSMPPPKKEHKSSTSSY